MKLNHINIPGLTTEILAADMQKRMAESKGAPVLYPYETVEALLSSIHDLETLAKANRKAVRKLKELLPNTRSADTRKEVDSVLDEMSARISNALGAPDSDADKSDW